MWKVVLWVTNKKHLKLSLHRRFSNFSTSHLSCLLFSPCSSPNIYVFSTLKLGTKRVDLKSFTGKSVILNGTFITKHITWYTLYKGISFRISSRNYRFTLQSFSWMNAMNVICFIHEWMQFAFLKSTNI